MHCPLMGWGLDVGLLDAADDLIVQKECVPCLVGFVAGGLRALALFCVVLELALCRMRLILLPNAPWK